MGRYAVATDVAQSPGREINEPMVAVLYPVMSRLQSDMPALRDVYLKNPGMDRFHLRGDGRRRGIGRTRYAAAGAGDKWIGIAPLMSWLAIGGAVAGLSSGAYSLFDALNQPRIGARMIWIRLFILGAAIVPIAFWTKSLIDIAICRAVARRSFYLVCSMPCIAWPISVSSSMLKRFIVRFLASALMAIAVIAANLTLPISGNTRLAMDIGLGAAVFLGSAWLLWRAAGRPHTPEATFFALSPR